MSRTYHKYTKEQLEYLKKISPNHTVKETTELFNEKFGLNQSTRKIAEYRQKHNIPSKYSNKQSINKDGTFKRGGTPWNKSKKGHMGANSTSFKKGQKSHNWVPIGSERLTEDGYIQVKVQDGKLQHNWKGKHILVWEKHHGKIPKGHVIMFGDGNKRNIDIDNLICVSRGQLARLNKTGMIQNSARLTQVAINVIDIELKISELEKK